MVFKLILVPKLPTDLVLEPETPLSGVAFLDKAALCLHRNLDDTMTYRHQTLGAVAKYEISVPQTMAIESNFFKNESERFLIVENNALSKYIFYAASISHGNAARACYPYYKDQIVLMSYIDELEFLAQWKTLGYPESMVPTEPVSEPPTT